MPIELGVWRIDERLSAVPHQGMDNEKRLEDLLEHDIRLVGPHLMVIGRQVATSFGKWVDLLAIDADGKLSVIELKRNMTPREVVAQVLDYGSWVTGLQAEDIARIWDEYQRRKRGDGERVPFDAAFCQRFNLDEVPDELNSEHELIVVASVLDDSTERIVNYLAEHHEVGINAILFRLFKDGDREYLTRVWLRDPTGSTDESKTESPKRGWNGEYYVSFGGGRNWNEAVKYGFISGGGGGFFTKTLLLLSPGDRIWVNVPGRGYVGTGRVVEGRVPAQEFVVTDEHGKRMPITSLPLVIAQKAARHTDPESWEYLVRVDWLKTVPVEQAVKEVGFFGNQNTVARPRTPQWVHTVERLKQRFGIDQ
jgi:hypothetical protein